MPMHGYMPRRPFISPCKCPTSSPPPPIECTFVASRHTPSQVCVCMCACLCIVLSYCTVLCCAVLYCTVWVRVCVLLQSFGHQRDAIDYQTVLYCTVLYCTVLHCTALHCTVLHCAAFSCTASLLHGTMLHCPVLYCTRPRHSSCGTLLWTFCFIKHLIVCVSIHLIFLIYTRV